VLQIGVASTGVNLYRRRQLMREYAWSAIKHIHFDKKKFILVSKGEKGASVTQTFFLQTRELCKVGLPYTGIVLTVRVSRLVLVVHMFTSSLFANQHVNAMQALFNSAVQHYRFLRISAADASIDTPSKRRLPRLRGRGDSDTKHQVSGQY
jgi:hypothetical protein